ncbi:MAG: 2-amino-4-hydroxy-6-hydroxymethyldihydropteridine diphosphokinase [Chloroflexota bacterium]
MTSIYLSMGSNLGDRENNLRSALRDLAPGIGISGVSSVYETAPVGVTDQPPFLNVAVSAKTGLEPQPLLKALQVIEQEVGRRPTYRWGPRIVDIDILLYGDLVLETPDLVIPHPRMHQRAFVLVPLAEIAPDLRHPVIGKSMSELAQEVAGRDSVRRDPGIRLAMNRPAR